MRTPFTERAVEMGLAPVAYKGLYSYSDRYSEVVYRQIITLPRGSVVEGHPTDGFLLPGLAIFTKPHDKEEYEYCGMVSDAYKFVGNDVINQQVRDSIMEVGIPILTENTILNQNFTTMRTEMIIQSSQNVAEVGDVLPVAIVENSYNGTRAESLSFGISTVVNSERVIFSFSLGRMRQVHIDGSNTEMISAISSYMQTFNLSIVELITNSFNSRLDEHQMLATLEVIEQISKNRKKEISKILSEMNPTPEGEEPQLPSAWQMFLAIVRYSSFEPNLNVKRLLENAAESVLVIPTRMYDVLERLETG